VNRVEELLRSMTWDEKLAQMQVVFRPDPAELDRWVRAGVGATFWPRSAAAVNAHPSAPPLPPESHR
jgi:beta-glucosidase